jgi:hypothetical protein
MHFENDHVKDSCLTHRYYHIWRSDNRHSYRVQHPSDNIHETTLDNNSEHFGGLHADRVLTVIYRWSGVPNGPQRLQQRQRLCGPSSKIISYTPCQRCRCYMVVDSGMTSFENERYSAPQCVSRQVLPRRRIWVLMRLLSLVHWKISMIRARVRNGVV